MANWKRFAFGLLALMATICGDCRPLWAQSTSAIEGGGILVPRHGALLGHFYGDGSVFKTDERIGLRPKVRLAYYGWRDDWASGATRRDIAVGTIPLVNWEPAGVDFHDIVNGKFDSLIATAADRARKLGAKLFLDFAAEMNGDEGWSGHDAPLYIAAYRHMHDIFAAHGASNVIWLWCPNNTDSPHSPPALAYYPGDAYVDWTGIDGYNWGTARPGFRWQSFYSVFKRMYANLQTIGKPVIIGEMASAEKGGSKADWIGRIVPTLRTKFPLIKAVTWFDIRKERHWEINSSPKSLAAYQAYAKNPYMNP